MDSIAFGAKLELARRDFFSYCNLLAPDFYKLDRQYLVNFCQELQGFLNSPEKVMIVNMPPRHGKSRTASMFVDWMLGKNPQLKIMTGSYNTILSTTFSKSVRNTILEEKADMFRPVYSDVFPDTKIKKGDSAVNMWSVEGGYNNYLATSPDGTATGMGCNLMIIDDLIKNALEANNENIKEGHWSWFTNTMLSRLEEGGKIIIIMTRWATNDLAGKALEFYGKAGTKIKHINLKAMQDDGTMLCPEVLSVASCEEKKLAMGRDIWSANYQQEPLDIKGRLYEHFKIYTGALPMFRYIMNYTDTADEGKDFLCSIDYGVTFAGEAYVLNVLYTKASMEITEKQVARMLVKDKVNRARVESNNGGRGFARNVERIMREQLGSNHTVVSWFHQSQNKVARILSNSSWVMEHIYFPEDWKNRWPDYYDAMTKYQREGKNAHDDAPDATTGIAENMMGNAVTAAKINL